ncbi:MAG: electron transfer flavoprotein subunit alpha/FixB family protein [Anaerolineales bacterium]|nr:electron transfer flavoprotein subunit alpha/FixB family protein [Anaerolineales bacterium]
MTRRFWVFLEQKNGVLHPVAGELLGVTRRLASEIQDELDRDNEQAVVEGILAGHNVTHLAKEAIQLGADFVYTVNDPNLQHYLNRPYTETMVTLVRKYDPEVFLIGATTMGRDLAGSVATSLETGLTADCTRLDMGPTRRSPRKKLNATRPAFGGNVIATIICENHRPQMATVRPRVFETPEVNPDAAGEIIEEHVSITPEMMAAEVVEILTNENGPVNLEYADVIVTGGKGLGKPEGFSLLQELADELGGVVGASRACVDGGWISYDHQVGQTGKTVRPKLYIAAGVSGAIQHKVGMQDSDFIVAINSDPDAPIFEVATVGLIGDLYQVIPAMISTLRARKGEQA